MTDVQRVMKAKTKWTVFLFVTLVSGLLIVGARAGTASNSDTAWTLLKTQSQQNWISPTSRLLIADRIDTQDGIIYSTDPDMDRAMEEQEKLEKEKEEKSWEMLQNMNIYEGSRRSHGPTQSDRAPQE